jgi:hypothetical protein
MKKEPNRVAGEVSLPRPHTTPRTGRFRSDYVAADAIVGDG